jgi:phage terminase small subunit
MSRLPERWDRFITAYLRQEKPNATEAAKEAGFSPRSAHVEASRLLKNPKVQAEMDRRKKPVIEQSKLDMLTVTNTIHRLLTFDPRKAFNPDGTTKRIHEMPDDLVAALAGIEVDEKTGEVKKFRFTDRARVAEMAARMVTDKNGKPLIDDALKIDMSGFTKDELQGFIRSRAQANGHANGNGGGH